MHYFKQVLLLFNIYKYLSTFYYCFIISDYIL